jgi:glycosyltransferase involved in cell wall biosynthesis
VTILISHDIFAAQLAGGVSRCMIELMRSLAELTPDWKLFAGRNANQLLASERQSDWYVRHAIADAGKAGVHRSLDLWHNERELARQAAAGRGLIHRSYHPVIDLLPKKQRVVETVHDLWDFVAPDERGARSALRRWIKRRAIARADRIICVSQSTFDYLTELWPAAAARASVIPHGTSRLSTRPVRVDRPRPFFLYVGRRDRYKNFALLLEAMPRLNAAIELICFGGDAFTAAEQAQLGAAGLDGRIHQVGGGDDILAGYYEAARGLVYPSLHEGFGLPLLEAMSHDCPVIAAPLTSLPEVGGTAALYADAHDPDAWVEMMTRLIEDDAFYAAARTRGRARAAKFTWSSTAQQHLALYDQVAAA